MEESKKTVTHHIPRSSSRLYVPETPERERRADALESFREDLRREQENLPTFETHYPMLDQWGNPVGEGWTEEDLTEEYIEPMEEEREMDDTTAEPALMSWQARASSSPIIMREPDFLDRYIHTPPVLRPIPRRNYTEGVIPDTPFTPRLRQENPFRYLGTEPGSLANPIDLTASPKGTEDDPIIIE